MKNPPDDVGTPDWASVLGGLVVLFLLTSFALVAGGEWVWFANFLVSAASDWVQAIGSIAAIWGAFSIANRQQKTQMARDFQSARQQRRQRFETCTAIINRATALFDSAIEALEQHHTTKLLRSELAHAEKMLASMPLFEIPDSTLVHRFGLIGQSLSQLGIILDQVDGTEGRATALSYVSHIKQFSTEAKVSFHYCAGLVWACSTAEEINGGNLEGPTLETIRKYVESHVDKNSSA